MMFCEKENLSNGRLLTFEMTMEAFEDKRKRLIRVYLPKEYDGKRRYPVLYMHDGQNIFVREPKAHNGWQVHLELEKLQKEGFSAIVVGIDNASTRLSELCPDMPVNPDLFDICHLPHEELVPTGHLYAQFIVEQLKPIIDVSFMTLPDAEHTVIGGSSMGGLMSLYMFLKYPDIFSKALVFSPNFVTHKPDILMNWVTSIQMDKFCHHRAFFFHGGIGLEADNWPHVQNVFTAMKEMGMDDTQLALVYDSRQPHYETAWRKYFAEAFRFLFLEDNSESKYYQ